MMRSVLTPVSSNEQGPGPVGSAGNKTQLRLIQDSIFFKGWNRGGDKGMNKPITGNIIISKFNPLNAFLASY